MAVANRLEELDCWRLACALRDDIEETVENGSARLDADFADQIVRSSRSAPANIAEGFGHFKPRQFGKYLRIARASLMETRNHIHHGKKKYFSDAEVEHLLRLARRATAATSRLLGYLDSCPPDFDPRGGRNDSNRTNRRGSQPSSSLKPRDLRETEPPESNQNRVTNPERRTLNPEPEP